MVVIEITVAPGAVRARQNPAQGGPPLRVPGQGANVTQRDSGVFQATHIGDMDTLAVEPGAAPPLGPGSLVEYRRQRNAQHQFVTMHERDLGGEKRISPHETLGAVQGIHQPAVFGIGLRCPGLLSGKTVFRKPIQQDRPDNVFGLAVRHGYRRLVRFQFYFEIAVVKTEDDLAGPAGRVQRRFEKR